MGAVDIYYKQPQKMNIERIKHLVTNLLTGSSSTSERTELAKWINSEDAERRSMEKCL